MNDEVLKLINNLKILNGKELVFEEDMLVVADLYTKDCDVTLSRLNEDIENLINC
jgi:hypothetical protein